MNGFQTPYFNPYGMSGYGQMQTTPATPSQQVVRVNGENGARAYQMGANSSALLLDDSGTMIWLCTTDGAGYKTVSAYDIAPHKSEQAMQYDSLENRIKRLEDMMNGYTGNTSAAEPKQSFADRRTGAAHDEHGAVGAEPTGYAEPARHEQPATETGYGYRSAIRGRSGDGTAGGV